MIMTYESPMFPCLIVSASLRNAQDVSAFEELSNVRYTGMVYFVLSEHQHWKYSIDTHWIAADASSGCGLCFCVRD
jgi:hypothetical protein